METNKFFKNKKQNVGLYHYYRSEAYYSLPNMYEPQKMHGAKRVIVFCILIVILPAILIVIPLYLRKIVFADVVYPVAESDIIEIRDGISSIFCQQHSLQMTSRFNAFQLQNKPQIGVNRKHIRLKKSMTLPDDTLEYWGFYLLKGAKVSLRFCSRYDGSRILVVKGGRELKTCGLLEHNKNKFGANFAQGHDHVSVFFEDITEFNDSILNHTTNTSSTNHEKNESNINEKENNGGEILYDEEQLPTELSNPIKKDEYSDFTTPENVSHNDKSIPSATVQRRRRHYTYTTKSKPNIDEKQQNINCTENPRKRKEARKKQLYDKLYKNGLNERRQKRDHVYDRKYSHGGNAVNFTGNDDSNSISSFENGLLECYNGNILLAEGFPPTSECTSAQFLENGSHRMISKHEITEDGYYYYIFYSDNDFVRNDIHAIFDIYKPTFQYSNLTDSKGCVNITNCTFPIGFLSDEVVVVEVPTRDGIEHEEDDITYLISTCHPRKHIYAVFPITVLILILSCSFI